MLDLICHGANQFSVFLCLPKPLVNLAFREAVLSCQTSYLGPCRFFTTQRKVNFNADLFHVLRHPSALSIGLLWHYVSFLEHL